MLSKIMKKVAVFMCCTTVAIGSLGVGSAFACETDKGSLTVTYQYGAQSTRGRDFRDTFNASSSQTANSFAIISMKESDGSYRASYCMDYKKVANKGDQLTANYTEISNEQKALVNYALVNGFSDEYSNPSDISTENANLYYATQCLVWVITEGAFYNDSERTQLENYFGVDNDTFKSTYETLYKKVYDQAALPECASTSKNGSSTINLTWNSSSSAYEAEVSNIGILANAKCSDLPDGVSVSINDGKMSIKSTKELTNQSIKLTIESSTKGGVVCWSNSAGHQPQATIDQQETVTDYDSYVNISTDKKSEETKPAEATAEPKKDVVEDNNTPKQDTPEVKEDTPSVNIVTAAPEASVQPQSSDVNNEEGPLPKTGDNKPIFVVGIILGIALLGGIGFGVKTIIDKKSNN